MGPPLVGSKRGVPAVNNPAKLFLLANIEGEQAILRPLVYPEALMQLTLWNHAGNPYYNNRALKMRCFISATINLIMLDDFVDKTPTAQRADWRGYQLICITAAYNGFKDEISSDARQAFQEGVKRFSRKLIAWGLKGEEPNLDYTVVLGLWYATQVCADDEAFKKEAEAHVKMMLSDPRYFHPAGYVIERGGLDLGFAGQTNQFVVATALASDWPFAKEAVEKIYRLRSHLTLPEPDGTITGPAAFNTRLCSPAHADQWDMGWREQAALMVTDEAACWVKLPAAEDLSKAGFKRASEFARQVAENPIFSGNGSAETPYVYFKNEQIPGQPWRTAIFDNWQFPLSMNFGYEFYRKGSYAHLADLHAKKSPMLQLPFARPGTFVRDFGSAFVVAKQADYGVVLHTGPVGTQKAGDPLFQLGAPLGFGGGQISAFWTPATGSVILGRRGGMIHGNPFDKIEEWRNWPLHAVSGATADGTVFTSARIATPATDVDAKKDHAKATVKGQLTAMKLVPDAESKPDKPKLNNYDAPLAGKVDYARTFKIEGKKLEVETKVTSSGEEKIAELYETIPVYLRDLKSQPNATPTAIEFEVDGKWVTPTDAFTDKVKAVKLTRFDGAVEIKFEHPVRIKLSPTEWKDTVALAFGSCRNLMIDLMPAGNGGAFKSATVAYSIAAVKK